MAFTRCKALLSSMLLTSALACGSDGGDEDPQTPSDGLMRGTFVWVDGSETNFEQRAAYSRFSLGGDVQHNCLADDLENRLSLGVSWNDGTEPGTIEVSFMGPYVSTSWPHLDGDRVRATIPSQGAITFDSIGTEDGDVVAGGADVMLSPDPNDPDDRMAQIVAIEFRCVVTEG